MTLSQTKLNLRRRRTLWKPLSPVPAPFCDSSNQSQTTNQGHPHGARVFSYFAPG